MLNWLLMPEPLRSFVAGAGLIVCALVLLALMPSRREGLVARRIAALYPTSTPVGPGALRRLDRAMGAAMPYFLWALGPNGQQQLRRLVQRSTVLRRFGVLIFAVGQVLLAALCGALAWLVLGRSGDQGSLLQWSYCALGAALGAYAPDLALREMAAHRLREIEIALPDALDLLVICAEAGLSFETSLDRITAELAPNQPALAAELAATSADLRVLPDREAAFTALAARVPLKSMQAVTMTLVHTLKYGTPLVQSLRVMASTLRNEALLKLEERAGRMPALMTIPMIVFTLPATFFIIAGPAALRILDVLR